jgi:hypothetical protein
MSMGSAKARCLDGDDCQVRVIHLDRVEQARRETVSQKELNWLASIYNGHIASIAPIQRPIAGEKPSGRPGDLLFPR